MLCDLFVIMIIIIHRNLDPWPSDLENGLQVTCDMHNFDNYSELTTALRSRVMSKQEINRQTNEGLYAIRNGACARGGPYSNHNALSDQHKVTAVVFW